MPRDSKVYKYAGTWYMTWNDCLFIGTLIENSYSSAWVWNKVAEAE